MPTISDLQLELDQLQGGTFPQTMTLLGAGQLSFVLQMTAVETLSCSLESLVLKPPANSGLSIAALEDWAKQLSQQLTYLLENVAPLEIDSHSQQILVRSTHPSSQAGDKEYYEMLLAVDPQGCLRWVRYRVEKHNSHRTQIDLVFTREVLARLLSDLESSFAAVVP